VLSGLASYAAQVLRPWVWPLCVVAAVSFAVFVVSRLWVCGCGIRMAKRAREREVAAGDHATRQRFAGGAVRVFVKAVALLSSVSGKIAGAAALVACVGVLAAVLTSSPLGTSTVAGAAGPLLATAQQALRDSAPAAYAKAADLASPAVTTEGDTTTFTFKVAKESSGKAGSERSFSVTIGPNGVQVGETR
jgi:hypothetical protein